VLSGPDSTYYDPTASADAMTVKLTSKKRTFAIMPARPNNNPATPSTGNYAQDRTLDYFNGINPGLVLYAGVESKPVTISVGAIPTNVAVVLEGEGLIFNPSVVRFTGAYDSLSFTVTAPTHMHGGSYIHFSVIGQDAGLFEVPNIQYVVVHPNFVLPEFPTLSIGVPATVSMSIVSNITAPVVVTPSMIGGYITFLPESLLFSPDQTTVTFQVVAAAGPTTQSFQFYWRDMFAGVGTDGENLWPFPLGAVGINVVPGTFIISYPHLTIGQTGTVTVTTDVAPRTDVVLSFYGNNLNIVPSYVLITPNKRTATAQITPMHADYKDFLQNAFIVEYGVTGTNANEFIEPEDTMLAVTRGSAPQADSLVLANASSPAAYISMAMLVAASLLALLF